MYRHVLPALTAFLVTLALSPLVKAESSEATVVVYRADEASRTEHLTFGLTEGQRLVGRVRSEKSVVLNAPAGSYTLNTTLPGSEPLTLDLKPGGVYYVHSRLKMTGNQIDLDLVEVAEQIAQSQGAEAFSGTI